MRFEARIDVSHLPGVLDPQGATVERALPALGYENVSEVSIAKTIRLVLDASSEDAAARAGRRDVPTPARQPRHRAVHDQPHRSAGGQGVSTRVGIVLFPGTNCELDVAWAVEQLGGEAETLWHEDATVGGVDAIVVPGGFAHGDYLRTGAIARFSPVMAAVGEFAAAGGPVVGICNGFQVLTEAGLLPGALQKNVGLSFLCETVEVRVVTTASVLTALAHTGDVLRVPINHFEGNYVCDPDTLRRLRDDDRIVLRYVDNPNGSLDDIAGIANEAGNVVGLMPHPERERRADRIRRRRRTPTLAARLRCRRRETQRVTPAFFSVSADTPSCRHAA